MVWLSVGVLSPPDEIRRGRRFAWPYCYTPQVKDRLLPHNQPVVNPLVIEVALDAPSRPRPGLHLGPQPEQGPTDAEINYRTWHLRVPLLVAANGIPMTQSQKLGNALRVDEIIGPNSKRHPMEPTGVD